MNRKDSKPLAAPEPLTCPQRRQALRMCAGAMFGMAAGMTGEALADDAAAARPQVGDRLVLAEREGAPVPLRLADLRTGAALVQALPFDPASGVVRDGSRLNKLILLRLAPDALDPTAARHAADGVLAFSAVCTHQGCNITEFNTEKGLLLCFCHFSQFKPSAGGERVAGPAPRRLPMLPLKLDGDVLVVAEGFTSRPGATL